jgi:GntR family transcriptional regulator/MocR family aminotransferase
LQIVGGDAGLHLVLRLPDGVDDREVAKAALAVKIVVRPLSGYVLRPGEGMSGLLIGYGCVPEEEIEPAFEKLTAVLDPALRGRVS